MSDEPPEPTLPRFPASKAADAFFGPSRKRARPDIFDGSNGGSTTPAHQLMLNNSSDPAVFSSDDDPALDNYAPDPATGGHTRKKKRYVGAWFAQHPASTDSTFDGGEHTGYRDGQGGDQGDEEDGPLPNMRQRSPVRLRQANLPIISSPLRPQAKRAFERQFDSGIYMDRDGAGLKSARAAERPEANGDEDGTMDEDEMARRAMESSPPPPSQTSESSQLSLAPPPQPPADTDFPPPAPRQRRVFQRVSSLAVDHAERKARALIQECIEQGNEKVSLIGLGLNNLLNATIEPLSGLVPFPLVTEDVAFEQKDTELKLFLSSNSLSRLPGAIFNIEHLTVLSLRGNRLTEIPPAIGKLKNLRSLNVSLNRLRYLPAELLPLLRARGQGGKLDELLAFPNSFYSHEEHEDSNTPSNVPDREDWSACCVARSPVCYKDSYGIVHSEFNLHEVADVLPVMAKGVSPTPPSLARPIFSRNESSSGSLDPNEPPPSRVPTLLEVALKACYSAPQLAQLANMLPDDAPEHIRRQLEKTVSLRESGGCTCCVCDKPDVPLVSPMTEWIEWWLMGMGDRVDVHDSFNDRHLNPNGGTPSARSTGLMIDRTLLLPFAFRGCSWKCVPAAADSS